MQSCGLSLVLTLPASDCSISLACRLHNQCLKACFAILALHCLVRFRMVPLNWTVNDMNCPWEDILWLSVRPALLRIVPITGHLLRFPWPCCANNVVLCAGLHAFAKVWFRTEDTRWIATFGKHPDWTVAEMGAQLRLAPVYHQVGRTAKFVALAASQSHMYAKSNNAQKVRRLA